MTAKIIPIGRDYRRTDYIAPRTLQEATGQRCTVEKMKVPKSYLEMAGIALLVAGGFLVVMVALSYWR